jgi:predicted enzyme related to lactoylglutathione lyase
MGINTQRTISAATAGIRGGIRQDPADTVFYLGVPDVNAAQDAVVAAGGTVVIKRMAGSWRRDVRALQGSSR